MFLVEPIHPRVRPSKDKGKLRECANVRTMVVRGLSKRIEERSGRGRTSSRVAVHLSLISQGTPSSSRLSTVKPPGSRASGWERWIRPQRACPCEAWFILSLFESGQHNSGPFRRQLFTLPRLALRARHGGANEDGRGSLRRGINRYRSHTPSLPASARIETTSYWLSRVEKLQGYFAALCNFDFLTHYLYIAIYVERY